MKIHFPIIAICISLHSYFSNTAYSQDKSNLHELQIGEFVPRAIWKKIPVAKTTQLVILDFWSTWCANCLEAFPELESLHKKFSDSLLVVLINSYETKDEVDKRFSKYNGSKQGKSRISLPALPSLMGDSIFSKLFPNDLLPHQVWLDKDGKVLYITNSYNATTQNISKVLKGEQINVITKHDLGVLGYYPNQDGLFKVANPALISMSYSGFMKYCPGLGSGLAEDGDSVNGYYKKVFWNFDILSLFSNAFYFPKGISRRILETTQNSFFTSPNDNNELDQWKTKNFFSYELQIPYQDKANWWQYMQTDLNRFFGNLYNISGTIETRKFQAFVLTRLSKELSTVKKSEQLYLKKDTVLLHNSPFQQLTDYLQKNLEDIYKGVLFIDETSLDKLTKVNVEMHGDLRDFRKLKQQMRKNGFDITIQTREMEVLVVKDKK